MYSYRFSDHILTYLLNYSEISSDIFSDIYFDKFSDMQYGMTSILACPKLYPDRSSDISSVYPDRCLYRKPVAHQTGRRADTERALACCSI